ncbi:MAG: SPFH domain-containing protein [Candidatus Bathyarchaeota archaeon]|nr:SPFH domain-containing protein [Candidatus Bathyarchaeota archaeon]MDH5787007.1 SPFH domain-containing protein [Candidatus Bathyarchaeota archaeon]
MLEILVVLSATFAAVLVFVKLTYTVVQPHQAHVVVTRGKGRNVYCSREGLKSSYFHIPLIQQRSVLPLENIQLKIDNIAFRDKDLAKFSCDVVCWVNVQDPILAAERLGKVEAEQTIEGFRQVEADVKALIEAVSRTTTMKYEIVTLMGERQMFGETVEREIDQQLKGWGLELVDLEIIDFHDAEGYKVIENLEKRRAKEIESETRKKIAEKEKEAAIAESTAEKETELVKAQNEEAYRTRQIEKEEAIGKKEQMKHMRISEQEQKANRQAVEATRTKTVGEAEVHKEASIKRSEGEAESTRVKGKADADVIDLKGTAEAEVTKKKLLSEATGKDALAIALKKFNEAGILLELITAIRDVQLGKYKNLGEALQKANVNLITSGEKDILGIPVGADLGADVGAMITAMEKAGFDIKGLIQAIGEVAKDVLPTSKKNKPETNQ